nr:hypothetical protein [uncultured Carboxylicivirga sp.]
MHRLFFLLLLVLMCNSIFAQSFNPQQRAYLYRIVQKTPVLYHNLQQYFLFNKESFIQYNAYKSNVDYNAIEYYQINNPDSLQIDWSGIALTDPGLIAETATLLALYELNEQLKTIVNNDQYADKLYLIFKTKLSKNLPSKMKDKKMDEILFTIIHPSLPLKIKLQKLNDFKLEPKTQQHAMNQWRIELNRTIENRSKDYFKLINPVNKFDHLLMLAAGEGSGTAGLLYETEPHPDGSNKSWYGKAIGLFTYEVVAHNNMVIPKDICSTVIKLSDDDGKAFHFSLWGLDSTFKPLVVITCKNKSYHLFSDSKTKTLSPDATESKGISYIDRIKQLQEELIDKPLFDLKSEGSLLAILEKEYQSKNDMESRLEKLGLEIDSLQKMEPVSETAINYRRTLIDSHLTNLTKKAVRIKELEDKVAKEYKQLDNAQRKIEKMEALLGPNPQSWKKKDSIYYFADGVWFNIASQDLVFPDSIKPNEVKIDLLSASYSLLGAQRDEIQLLANTVSSPVIKTPEPSAIKVDTIQLKHYFNPDEFSIKKDFINDVLNDSLPSIDIEIIIQPTIAINSKPQHYKNIEREFELPLTQFGKQRLVNADIINNGDSIRITITSFTDPVATRLSQLPSEIRQKLNVQNYSKENNKYLAMLRALAFLQRLPISIDSHNILFPKAIEEEESKLLFQHIMHD